MVKDGGLYYFLQRNKGLQILYKNCFCRANSSEAEVIYSGR